MKLLDKEVDGINAHIRFWHHAEHPHPHTYCELAIENQVFAGTAYCHPNDQYSKAKGRKLALERAMQGIARDLRVKVWTGYFKVMS